MSDVPADLLFTQSHEWLRKEEDGSVTVGITDHAQQLLGDLVYVEPPELGLELAKGDACAVVESVKAASDVYAPIAAEVLAVNESLEDAPETLNSDPYGEGWIMRLQPIGAWDESDLLDADGYSALCADEEH